MRLNHHQSPEEGDELPQSSENIKTELNTVSHTINHLIEASYVVIEGDTWSKIWEKIGINPDILQVNFLLGSKSLIGKLIRRTNTGIEVTGQNKKVTHLAIM